MSCLFRGIDVGDRVGVVIDILDDLAVRVGDIDHAPGGIIEVGNEIAVGLRAFQITPVIEAILGLVAGPAVDFTQATYAIVTVLDVDLARLSLLMSFRIVGVPALLPEIGLAPESLQMHAAPRRLDCASPNPRHGIRRTKVMKLVGLRAHSAVLTQSSMLVFEPWTARLQNKLIAKSASHISDGCPWSNGKVWHRRRHSSELVFGETGAVDAEFRVELWVCLLRFEPVYSVSSSSFGYFHVM